MRLLILACCALAGCVNGIPDADPPVPAPKTCDVRVNDNGHLRCMTREEFQRWMRTVMGPNARLP